MPYGLPGAMNNPANNAKMERCVRTVMNKPGFKPNAGETKKGAAVAICKASMMGTSRRAAVKKRLKK